LEFAVHNGKIFASQRIIDKNNIFQFSTSSNYSESHLVFLIDADLTLHKTLLLSYEGENSIPMGESGSQGSFRMIALYDGIQANFSWTGGELTFETISNYNNQNSRVEVGPGCECMYEVMYCAATLIDEMGVVSKVACMYNAPLCVAIAAGDCLFDKCADFDNRWLCEDEIF